MKNIKYTFLFLLLCFFPVSLFAEEDVNINAKTGFPEITEKPFVVFDWGASAAWVTRIQFKENRSNFVFEDTLAGAYFTMRTHYMKPIDSLLRVSAYYPILSTFNNVQQVPKQTLLYAFDLFYAPVFEADMWKYVRIEFAPGIHFLYQLSDNWHYMSAGAGAFLGAELPLSKGWSFIFNALGTLDYPNLGSNSQMFPFSVSWEYQLAFGARYSRRKPNTYSYITSKKNVQDAD